MAAYGAGGYPRYQHNTDNSSYSHHSANAYSPGAPISPLLPSQRLPQLQTNNRDVRNDHNFSLVSPMMSRSPSIASDSRFSNLSGATGTFPANPANVKPAAAYVAPFGAVQVVTEPRGRRPVDSDDDDDEQIKPQKDEITFTPAALALINAFLDQLLFSILSQAKSTALNALKSAVTDILKNKLARDAIASAEEELRDLLSGNDEEDDKPLDKEGDGKWDLELVWKRTRLRVMVYMRLGEMEDEDEERYVKEQGLRINGEHSRFSSTAGLVSWSAAIFLTSVLEHVAEQTLRVAGTAATATARRRGHTFQDAAGAPLVIVDEQDVERIAVNPSLGRLWRSWRKTVRTTTRPVTPTQHRDIASIITPTKSLSSPRDSFGTAPESAHEDETARLDRMANNPPDTSYPEHIMASNIRLPMGDALRDVDEIEVPGLARDPSEVGSDAGIPTTTLFERRKSFSNYQSQQSENEALSQPIGEDAADEVPRLKRRRSSSVPALLRKAAQPVQRSDGSAQRAAELQRPMPEYGPPTKENAGPLLEDIDKRKSLIDIKTLLAAIDGGFAPFGATLDKIEDRPGSSESTRSFALNDSNGTTVPSQPLAEPQHMQTPDLAQIGVATTSDKVVAPDRTSAIPGTRSTPSPGPNLSRAPSIPRSKYSPNNVEDSQKAIIGTVPIAGNISQRDRPIVPSQQTLAALRDSVQRASSPQIASQPSVAQTSDSNSNNRQSVIEQLGIASAFSNQAQYWNRRSQQVQTLTQAESQDVSVGKPGTPANESRKSVVGLRASSIRGPDDFDELVQSDEVVKYTLTPETIREAPKSDAQALALLTGEVPPVINATNKDEADKRSSRSQKTKSQASASTEKKNRWSITRPLSRNTSAHRKSGLMARDARVVTESTRDFADFIRSTRPDKEPEIRPLVTNQSSSSLSSVRTSTNYSLPRSQSLTGDRTRSLTRTDIDAGHAPPVPSLPTSGKSQMQPKSAKGNDRTGNSELITFIRDGPKQAGEHRVPRTVAPFRSTMDSEQFDDFKTASRPVQPATSTYSQDSTQPSTHASMNSRAPLLNGFSTATSSVAQPAYSGKAQSLSALTSNPPDITAPERKRYRNKDPYALDFDDEEEDVSALPKGKRGGESLAEFLRNAEPSKDGEAKPIASAASIAQARELRERARANNVNGSRRDSYYSSAVTPGVTDDTTTPVALGSQVSASTQPRSTTNGRAGDRIGANNASNTKDLADFLRNSGPASAPAVSRGGQSQATQQSSSSKKPEKKSRGFFSFFRKSTKGKPTQHADMP